MVIEIREKIKTLLDMQDTSIYDDKLDILIDASMQNVESQIPIPLNSSVAWFNEYVMVLLPDVVKSLPLEIDLKKYNQMRLTKLNELRMRKPWNIL